MSDKPYGCKCQTLHHKLSGDGCDECNPETVAQIAEDNAKEFEKQIQAAIDWHEFNPFAINALQHQKMTDALDLYCANNPSPTYQHAALAIMIKAYHLKCEEARCKPSEIICRKCGLREQRGEQPIIDF